MKQFYALLLVFISLCSSAQTPIEPYKLDITLRKTTNLIFPYAIKSVDRGSKDVFVQKAPGVENVLQVKAAVINFPATNISVITADGKLYCFLVTYSPSPVVLNLSFSNLSNPATGRQGMQNNQLHAMVSFEESALNPASLDSAAALIVREKPFLDRSVCDQKVLLTLQSIYICKEVLWFSFDLHNYSPIDFKPGYIKFFIGDKHKIKRTAEQEIALVPVYQTDVIKIDAKHNVQIRFAFPLFTLPEDKQMVCQISERNGGRILTLHIGHRVLLKAKSLSEN